MSDLLAGFDRYPLHWRVLDLIDNAVERFVPALVARATPFFMLLPALFLVGLLVVGLVLVADQSFHLLDPATYLLRDAYSIENYRVVFSRGLYWELAGRSAGTAFLIAAICVVLAFPYAYVMVRAPSALLKKALLCCIFFPFLLGAIVRGFAWLVVLGREGLVNQVLHVFGLSATLVYNMAGVRIGLVQLYLPLAIMIIAPALTAIEEDIDEAAQSLGASWLRALRTVILPMAAPGLVNAFVLVLTLVFSDVAIPSILGGGRTDFITNAIYKSYMETGDRGVGAALCVVTTATAAGMILLFFLGRGLIAAQRSRSHA